MDIYKKLPLILALIATSTFPLNECRFETLKGKQPTQSCTMRDSFYKTIMAQRREKETDSPLSTTMPLNRLLAEGDTGNGKSETFNGIIAYAQVKSFVILGSELNEAYAKDNVERLREKVKEADRYARIHGEMVGLRIEDLHEAPSEAEGFLKEILDDPHYSSTINFLCSTNEIDKMSPELISRFGPRVIRLYNPDAQAREEIISELNEAYRIGLNSDQRAYLVKQTEKCPRRIIKYIFESLKHDYENIGSEELDESVDTCKSTSLNAQEKREEQKRNEELKNNLQTIVNIIVVANTLKNLKDPALAVGGKIISAGKGLLGSGDQAS